VGGFPGVNPAPPIDTPARQATLPAWRPAWGIPAKIRVMPCHKVTFVASDRELQIEVSEDEYLLDAAAGAGLGLPFMCLQGWCTTCAGKILEGKVDQSEALRLYPEDEKAGFVLLCSAFARSDLRILTHQRDALRVLREAHGLPTPRG
jgi:ferredoxin